MKKKRGILYLGILLLAVFIGVSVFTFFKSNQMIEAGYLSSEGSAAENFAVLTASNIHLTDADVARLKSYSYAQLMKSEENEALRRMMDNDSFMTKVDYAYIMVQLSDDEVKYQVDETNQSLFDAAPGTRLDMMWLLDVNVSADAENLQALSAQELAGSEAAEDIHRYSYYIPEDDAILSEKPSYVLNKSEWGDHICGYAPVYTEEGNYIGAVGVELQTGDFNKYRNMAMLAMGILLCASTVTLTVLFVFIYLNYRKQQFERVYTDALTKCYNRSYYNSQFIKRMNVLETKGYYFALGILDIDWFKKVNDTFGHEAGDQVLMEVSELLMETFGRSQVVRFGGEEFVVGLWVKDSDTLQAQYKQLYEKIAQRKFSDRLIDISISLGCSYCRGEELSGWLLSGMLKEADHNLYDCKEHGRKQYRVTEHEGGEKTEGVS